MDFTAFKNEVIKQAGKAGLTDYELYCQSSDSIQLSAFRHEINEFSSGVEGGVCFRCVVDGKMGYASTQDQSLPQAEALVQRAMENARSLETEEAVLLCQGGQVYETPALSSAPLPSAGALSQTLLSLQDKLYAASPKVVDGCSSEGFAEKISLAICNSRGLDVSYENAMSALVVMAVVSDGGESENDFRLKLGTPETIDQDQLVKEAVEKALGKLGGSPAPTGSCPVVFAPDAMASLLQTFSSIFSSQRAQKGLSRLQGREGQVIASPLVTLVDDPFCPQSPMPLPFDAEGCPTRRKDVIQAGKLCTLLYNLKTAAAQGRETTGNASKQGYASPVEISPFAMYFAPGDLTREELLQKAGTGVYIDSVAGLHAGANQVTGDFSLMSAGFLIEGGALTRRVKSFTVAGNFYDLLLHITALSDTVRFPFPMGSTLFGSPHILVEGLSVAGK